VKKFFNKRFIILLLYVDNRLMTCDCWSWRTSLERWRDIWNIYNLYMHL